MSRLRLLALLGVSLVSACSSSADGSEGPPSDEVVLTGPDAGLPEDGGLPADGGTSVGPTADAGTEGEDITAGVCSTLPFPTPCVEPQPGTLVTAVSDWGVPGPHAVTVERVANPHPVARGQVITYRPTGLTTVPVLFFSHAFGATDADLYAELFQMLASQGYAVVFVPYPLTPDVERPNEARYDCLWQGFLAAVAQQQGRFDLTRVGFFGHSYGGAATPDMARRGFVDRGWGSNGRFLFSMAPWYSWGRDYATLPPDVRAVIQVYADDEVNDHATAVQDLWNKLPTGLERAWHTVVSDACGCGLNATHTVPMSRASLTQNPENVLNSQDRQAVWRPLHALAVYAFTGDTAARDVAFGTDRSQGSWLACRGRQVRPLLASRAVPLPTACHAYTYPYADRCQYADPGTPCP
ncbi:hypothetical protein OWM54_17990 [Myxococcus sp. MISCRS1]|uniref:alpha/beta hydrolase family protein n=1 Tax=Myxococcus sp. MISCRS1 TaxID=2996786 RepID=UPI0022718EDF|nr:hypothetical protein [Myxococcus sp. MISCRS1]MCY0999034.1 hypothetical protein [Myxococcus sp. MISCRS1]